MTPRILPSSSMVLAFLLSVSIFGSCFASIYGDPYYWVLADGNFSVQIGTQPWTADVVSDGFTLPPYEEGNSSVIVDGKKSEFWIWGNSTFNFTQPLVTPLSTDIVAEVELSGNATDAYAEAGPDEIRQLVVKYKCLKQGTTVINVNFSVINYEGAVNGSIVFEYKKQCGYVMPTWELIVIIVAAAVGFVILVAVVVGICRKCCHKGYEPIQT